MVRDSVYGVIMRSLGVLSGFHRHRNGLVLCLHSVAESEGEAANFGAMAIRCEFLERIIVDLRRRGIALVSLREALKLATGSPGRLSRSRLMMVTGTITKLPIPF